MLSSYFASKKCTYTDASGKPVPAPRPLSSDRPESSSDARGGPYPPHPDAMTTGSPSFNVVPNQSNEVALSTPSSDDDRASNPRNKRLRPSLGNMTTPSETPPRSLAPPLTQHDQPVERDQALTRELVYRASPEHSFDAHPQTLTAVSSLLCFSTTSAHDHSPTFLLGGPESWYRPSTSPSRGVCSRSPTVETASVEVITLSIRWRNVRPRSCVPHVR